MAPRLQLQSLLETIVDNVYFQPPASIKLQYPCIVYARDDAMSTFADNKNYNHTIRYMVTVIDRNPDSDLPKELAVLPMCTFNRHYAADNLNHDVFNLFF